MDSEIGKSFRWLLENIIDRWSVLSTRVANDTEEQIKREKNLMKERLKRVQENRRQSSVHELKESSQRDLEKIIKNEPKSSSNLLVPPLSPISERSSILTNEDRASQNNSSSQNIQSEEQEEEEREKRTEEEEMVVDEEKHISGAKLNRIITQSDSLLDERNDSSDVTTTINNKTTISSLEVALIHPPSSATAATPHRSARSNKIYPSP